MANKKMSEAYLNTKGFSRGYIRFSKAWYSKLPTAQRHNEDISFGLYHKDGGCFAEMICEWVPLQRRICPQIKAFGDSWTLYGYFRDLFKKLEEYQDRDIGEEEFSTILDWHGFKDLTPYKNPSEAEEVKAENLLAGPALN